MNDTELVSAGDLAELARALVEDMPRLEELMRRPRVFKLPNGQRMHADRVFYAPGTNPRVILLAETSHDPQMKEAAESFLMSVDLVVSRGRRLLASKALKATDPRRAVIALSVCALEKWAWPPP